MSDILALSDFDNSDLFVAIILIRRSTSIHSTKSKCLIISSGRLENGANPFTFVTATKNGVNPFSNSYSGNKCTSCSGMECTTFQTSSNIGDGSEVFEKLLSRALMCLKSGRTECFRRSHQVAAFFSYKG